MLMKSHLRVAFFVVFKFSVANATLSFRYSFIFAAFATLYKSNFIDFQNSIQSCKISGTAIYIIFRIGNNTCFYRILMYARLPKYFVRQAGN